jgi:Holliday junction DNA helicase RuvA
MLERLRGKLIQKSYNKIIVETGGGLGFALHVPLSTSINLPNLETEVILETRLILREESVDLFGFLTKIERDSFDILTSVSRIGPKLALTIISAMDPKELAQALINQDLNKLSSIKGIGVKTAERILVELKDKAKKLLEASQISDGPKDSSLPSGSKVDPMVYSEASGALQTLGYTKQEADKVLKGVLSTCPPDTTAENLIREALKSLNR